MQYLFANCRNNASNALTDRERVVYAARFALHHPNVNLPPRQVILLAIDPGIHTGVALFDHDGTIIETYETTGEAYEVAELISKEPAHEVVIERGPQGRTNEYMDELDGWLRAVFPDAHWMYPGEWKGTPRAMQEVTGVPSHHARDAVRMGREFLFRQSLTSTSGTHT
jgi:hypothetical protein